MRGKGQGRETESPQAKEGRGGWGGEDTGDGASWKRRGPHVGISRPWAALSSHHMVHVPT